MDQIDQSDTKLLLDFVRHCYAIRDSEPLTDFPGKLVTALAKLIPSLHTTYNELCLETNEAFNIGSNPESSSPEVSILLQQFMHEHIPLLRYVRTGDGSAIRISDFQSRRQFHATGLYAGFYRQYDVEDDLCIGVFAEPFRSITIAWHGDRQFTGRDRCMANLVRPFIVQAWQNAKLVSGMQSQLQLLQQGMDGAALGVISCDADGRVRLITALARKYLANYFGAAKNQDRLLPEELLRWVRYQFAQLSRNDVPPVRLPLAVQKGDHRLTVRMLSNAGANLLLLEEKAVAAIAGLCLTRRESEVLALAAQGRTNGEIAAMLGMSPQTAKKHMEHILHKLGVENRTAAAAIALQSLSPDK